MNLRTVSVVRASTRDVDVLTGLLHNFLNELEGRQSASYEERRMTTKELMEEGLIIGVIAYIEKAPVGVLMLNECAAVYAGGRFGEITELYIVPDYRSSGVAQHLITEAKVIARERDWKRLEVGAPDQPVWSRTLNFYVREGFKEVGPRLRLLI